MSDVINILLVEDEKCEVERYCTLAQEQEGIEIVYSTGSERLALTYLQRHPVDVVILDLELEEGDGISLLDAMQEQELPPFTVVVTNTVSNVTLGYVRMNGADYVYRKINGTCAPLRVFSMIQKIYPYRRYRQLPKEHPMVECFNQEKRRLIIRNHTERELELMGVKRTLTGFDYLVEAIMLYLDIKDRKPYMSEIYPAIAADRHVSSESVEKAIRDAIESAFRSANIDLLRRHYPFSYSEALGRPTNMQFISNMAHRVDV